MNENEISSIDKIVENLFSMHPLITISLTRSIRTNTNLNLGSLYIMGLLYHHGMMSMSEIGCRLKMPKPHVTAKVDKLIAENIVERLFDPNDRRIINIQMTEKGKNDLKIIKQKVSQDLRERIQMLDPEKIKTMLDSSQHLRDYLTEIKDDYPSEKVPCEK
jgi:DNA-binding MarR family transcriptional regulator